MIVSQYGYVGRLKRTRIFLTTDSKNGVNDMLKYLPQYENKFRDELNIPLMEKSADEPLVEYIKDAWRSLEVAPAIKILKFEYTEDESKIDINRYIFKREKRKKKKDRVNYKFVQDSRCGSLTTWIQITLPVKNPKTGEITIEQKVFKKSILIPLKDERGYYYIKGKKYYLIFQLVEKSTYTGNQTVTLKSLMPIAIRRNSYDVEGMDVRTETVINMLNNDEGFAKKTDIVKEDVESVQYTLPVYSIFMFRKEMPVILFYLANGVEWALDYLGVSRIISFESNMDDRRDGEVWFSISAKSFLRVKDRELFLKYPYIQSIVGGILSVVSNRFTPAQIGDKSIWIKKLGNGNNYAKGLDMLTFFNRLLDKTTQRILLLDEYHKQDIYALIRWMMMNFNELRLKDNMNLYNKRIRCNEYISSLLTMEFSKRLNRVIAMGNKATVDNYKEIFKFPGEILLQKMHVSGVLRFDESINDMNFFSKFKVTSKGPHSLGNHDSNRISIRARGLHPSFLENFDILVCGSSDPGSSALLSPWGRIKGFYFDSNPEEDHFLYEFKQDLEDKEWEKVEENDNKYHLKINSSSKERYFEVLGKMQSMTNDVQAFGTSLEDPTMILESAEDVDEKKDGDSESENTTNEKD